EAHECTICLDAYADGELVKQLPCGHSYHAACIDEWLRKSAVCPLCKHMLWCGGARVCVPRRARLRRARGEPAVDARTRPHLPASLNTRPLPPPHPGTPSPCRCCPCT
ncbi:MAG: hypothetical protein J3K34DRAFT_368518, partial [Monoraphidium minutum]